MNIFDAAERQRLLRCLSKVARDQDQAEDLLQSAFVRLEEYRRDNQVENEAGFLVRAATNIAIDEARRTKTRREIGKPYDEIPYLSDQQPLQDEVLLAKERLQQARKGFAQLPQRTQDIFLMHRVSGLKYRDIAARLGITQSAVEKHIAKATLFMADWINKERHEAGESNLRQAKD